MFNVLQERGVPSRFLNFPDENHWYVARPFFPSFQSILHFSVIPWMYALGSEMLIFLLQGAQPRKQPRVAPAGPRVDQQVLRDWGVESRGD